MQLNSSLNKLVIKYSVDPFVDRYTEIRDASGEFCDLTKKYLEEINTLTMSLTEFYSNIGINLTALVEVSNHIRAEAIEPSFVMLQE